MNPDRQLQQYLFDLQGYLVLENALTPQELSWRTASGFLDWGQAFCAIRTGAHRQ